MATSEDSEGNPCGEQSAITGSWAGCHAPSILWSSSDAGDNARRGHHSAALLFSSGCGSGGGQGCPTRGQNKKIRDCVVRGGGRGGVARTVTVVHNSKGYGFAMRGVTGECLHTVVTVSML